MKNSLLLLISVFASQVLLAQDVKIIEHGEQNFRKQKNKAAFHFLEPSMDTTNLAFVATMEISGLNNPSLFAMYKKMRDQAKKMGANAYKVKRYSQSTIMMVVDVYQINENAIEENNLKKTQNTIYVFAGDPYEKSGYYTFEMNGIGKSVKNGTYYKYSLHEGEQIKLKKGTVAGTIMWVKWNPNQLSQYYTIHGFSDEAVVKRTTQSESFKEGKFVTIERALGDFLVTALEQKD